MRVRIPWSEIASLGAIYAVLVAFSARGGATVFGIAVLALALATTLSTRAFARAAGESARSAPVQLALVASGAAAVAVATQAAGPYPPTHALCVLRASSAAVAFGSAALVATGLASVTRAFVLAAPLAAATAFGLSGRESIAPYGSLAPTLASVVLGLAFAVRYARTPEPDLRARWVFTITSSLVAAALFALASLLAFEHDPGSSLAAAGAVLSGSLGLVLSATGRARERAPDVTRFIAAVFSGCAAGAGLAWVGVDGAIAASGGALVAACLVPLYRAELFKPDGGRLLAACHRAARGADRADGLDSLVTAVLEPLRAASRDLRAPISLWVLASESKYTLDVASAAHRSKFNPLSERALLAWMRGRMGEIVYTDALRPLEVRRPELRPVLLSLEEHGAFAAVPLLDGEDLGGVLLVPRGRRRGLPTLEEDIALRALAQRAAGALTTALALDRANVRSQELRTQLAESERARTTAETERDDAVTRLRNAPGVRVVGSLDEAWVGYSIAMRALESQLDDAASSDAPVTLVAEPGTLVASVVRAIHKRALRSGPCVFLDASSVHPRDALTLLVGGAKSSEPSNGDDDSIPPPGAARAPGLFELAAGGTLVLHDLPALGYDAHIALLEAIKTKTARPVREGDAYAITARIVVVLRTIPVESGLPAELCERLGTVTLTVPPLRARSEDLETLVLFAIDRACRLLARPAVGISREALGAIRAYSFPENERELFDALEHAVRSAQGAQLLLRDLPAAIRAAGSQSVPSMRAGRASTPPPDGRDDVGSSGGESYEALERRILESALERAGGNKSEAARALGLARTTFLDKLRKYGLRA